jgi:sigma-B regulation protein RsbU (phosphoserine phosphatase)
MNSDSIGGGESMMKFIDTETYSLKQPEQQLEAIIGPLTPSQRRLLWLPWSNRFAASEIQSMLPALGLPKIPPAQGDSWLNRLCELAQLYLQELATAVRVQQKMLPEQPPALPGVEISVRYLPLMGVSGDYYDFLPISSGQVGLALGDVCGKGMAAAMLMASVRSALRAQVQTPSTAALLAHLNEVVLRDAPRGHFVTLTYGVLDAVSHTYSYSNAGHPPVLHYQAVTGKVRELGVGGAVLGVWEEIEYPRETVSLETGDALVLYTDGIIEVSNASEEVFGIERLREVIDANGGESAEGLVEAILNAAWQFAHKGWEDDVTVLIVKTIPHNN